MGRGRIRSLTRTATLGACLAGAAAGLVGCGTATVTGRGVPADPRATQVPAVRVGTVGSGVSRFAGQPGSAPVFAPYVDLLAWPPYDLAGSVNSGGPHAFILCFVPASASRCSAPWGRV